MREFQIGDRVGVRQTSPSSARGWTGEVIRVSSRPGDSSTLCVVVRVRISDGLDGLDSEWVFAPKELKLIKTEPKPAKVKPKPKPKITKMPRVRFTQAEYTKMDHEGWCTIDASHDAATVREIERDDSAGVFKTDDDAIAHVMRRALAGSTLHVKALVEHCQSREHWVGALLEARKSSDDYEDAIDLLRRARAVLPGSDLKRDVGEFLAEGA